VNARQAPALPRRGADAAAALAWVLPGL